MNRTEAKLKELGKTYEFHRYDGAGHAFFNASRPAYRAEQAIDGWNKVFAFFHKHLATRPRHVRHNRQIKESNMCSYIVEKAKLFGSAKGPNGWMRIDTANVYYDHPFHAPLDHALGIDFINEAAGGRERVAVELSAESARELVEKILAALANGEVAHRKAAAPCCRGGIAAD